MLELKPLPIAYQLGVGSRYVYAFRWGGAAGKPGERQWRNALEARPLSVSVLPLAPVDSWAGFVSPSDRGVTVGDVYRSAIAQGATHGFVSLDTSGLPNISIDASMITQDIVDTPGNLGDWFARWWVLLLVIVLALASGAGLFLVKTGRLKLPKGRKR